MKRFTVPLSLLLVFGVTLSLAQEQSKTAAKGEEKPLYERLGGTYAIATVVDDFIERLLVNDVLNANPAIKEARDRVPKAGLKFRVTALVCQVTGGPEVYKGRNMYDAHKHLNITDKEWQAMVTDFKKTLDKFKVPAKEQQELMNIVESTKKDIVVMGGGSKK
ncbi:MAG TPA: group 1 truncated hemoglobin [Bacteroidota bacterium]|nr:group 1 truncated hemoglobin [Bacteroidota bacterium]